MRRLWLVAAIGIYGCGGEPKCESCEAPSGADVAKSALTREQQPSAANVAALGRGNRAFAFELYREVARSEAGNVLVSPYSVSTALAMTYAGARTTTESEMRAALHFTLEQAPLHEAFNATDLALSSRGEGKVGADGTPFRLNVDNSIWMQKDFPVEAPYLDTLALNYGAGVFLADFITAPEAARGAINAWVDDKTEQLIPELLPKGSIDTQTRFVLTNTVYFNASWRTKFEKEATHPQAFTKLDASAVTVDMMWGGWTMPYAEGDGFQAVALPYASEELSMIVVLPAQGRFDEIGQAFDAAKFDALVQALDSASVSLSFPKLDYRFHASLAPALKALGMNAPFASADFSGLTSESVVIDDVIHEAVIRVFEGGTIAAAATAVTLRAGSIPQYQHTVTLDRPFLFAIYDQPTGTILFLGRVLDPKG